MSTSEVAFRVRPGSDLYKRYFSHQKEQEHMVVVADDFFKRYNLDGVKKYCLQKELCANMTPELQESLKDQLLKRSDRPGMRTFRKNSIMQQLWSKEVCSQIDWKAIDSILGWWFQYMPKDSFRMGYSLWHYKEDVYGLLESPECVVELDDNMDEIPMSEYYRIIEEMEGAK